jgi:quinoprotein glucose dehydrogenase
VAWTYPFGDTGFNPIAVRGVIYGRGRNGSLVAVDATTGERAVGPREHGRHDEPRHELLGERRRPRSRLIFAMDSLLQQLDAKTGRSIMSFGTNGVVDLRVGIDGRDPATIGNIQSNTPGEVFENLIILGSATGEGYMSPPGDIRAYDVLTGRLVWTFHTVPRPGQFGYETWPKEAWKYVGGVNNWGEMTVDAARGIVYIPLGSPTYDFYGADRTGANLFGTSVVALDARTGTRLWHFQIVHHDLWDYDPSAAPQLTTIRHDGRDRDVVVVSSKTTWLYVFDRVTGEPIWPIEERPVPKSDMPGEESWPTQPYPTNPPPFGRQSFGVDDISPYLPADQAAAFREAAAGRQEPGALHADQLRRHRAHPGEQRRRAVRRHGVRAPRGRLRRHPRQPRDRAAGVRVRTPAAAELRRAARAARAGALSAALSGVPRRGPAGDGHRRAARARRRGPGQQHRRRRAALRCGGDPHRDRCGHRDGCRRFRI